jgi:hypothetical protein
MLFSCVLCCREGLDWLVHECSLRGLRVLPILTNGGSTQGGGMKQYIDWVDPELTVTDFYTNDTIKVCCHNDCASSTRVAQCEF